MPTPPYDPPSAIVAFAPMIARYKGQFVRDLSKELRFQNKAELARKRAKGVCLYPGCDLRKSKDFNPIDIHHKRRRGAGGGDENSNTIPLCRTHHQMAHNKSLPKGFFDWVAEVEA